MAKFAVRWDQMCILLTAKGVPLEQPVTGRP